VSGEKSTELPLRLAFYLPQFHPTIENDANYEAGFTEWNSVVSAKPHFSGHKQPILPGELGFYDLRVPETRQAQADLARQYGVSGFCYYHYWFQGHRVLRTPLDAVLASNAPDFPFCLLWANHEWRRKWFASSDEVIIPLEYSEDDDRVHIKWLLDVFKDPRYIRIDGRPVFGIYMTEDLPNPNRLVEIWKEESELAGEQPPWLIAFEAVDRRGEIPGDPRLIGFDAAAEFVPHHLYNRVELESPPPGANTPEPDSFFDYNKVADFLENRPDDEWTRYPCVAVGWDNSARRPSGSAFIFLNESQERYAQWLQHALKRQQSSNGSNGIVFINAWNEWAEGAMLEPDAERGRGRLEATKAALVALGATIQPPKEQHNVLSNIDDDLPYGRLRERAVALQRALSGFSAAADRRQWEMRSELEGTIQRLRQDNRYLVEKLEGMNALSPTVGESATDREFLRDRFERASALYLDLIKKVLTRSLFLNDAPGQNLEELAKTRYLRANGLDWPDEAETMVGLARLDNLQHCIQTVLREEIPGDLLEAGVWRGGASIFMTAVLEAFGDKTRNVYVADSFAGLPAPDVEKIPQEKIDLSIYDELAVGIEQVRANFERYGLLQDRVIFVKGLFKETLHRLPVKTISVLRLDGDYYESTIQSLEALYSRVPKGGFIIVDDYWALEPCRLAVADFRNAQTISEPIIDIDGMGAYWRKIS
jgi:hypothetical protein